MVSNFEVMFFSLGDLQTVNRYAFGEQSLADIRDIKSQFSISDDGMYARATSNFELLLALSICSISLLLRWINIEGLSVLSNKSVAKENIRIKRLLLEKDPLEVHREVWQI